MKEIIDRYKDIVISIATPYGSGTGFYVKNHNIIVTNHHVIKGAKEVIVSSKSFKKVLMPVLYNDPMYDLAFVQAPTDIDLPGVELATDTVLIEGNKVIAIGHPYGLKYTVTQGIVSKADRLHNNINYIQLDAAINPGNSGGPSVDEHGRVVGVNTFIIAGGNNLGFALPVSYLADSISEYEKNPGTNTTRCHSCGSVLVTDTIEDNYCTNCGAKMAYVEADKKEYEPAGYAAIMENIISNNGKDIKLARIGKNRWEVEEGSAKIIINYDDRTGFIYGDSHLCLLPKENLAKLYEYLLRENFNLEDVYFSVANTEIVMSILIYDQYLTEESGTRMIKNLIKKSDHYDDILVDDYGCIWKVEEVV